MWWWGEREGRAGALVVQVGSPAELREKLETHAQDLTRLEPQLEENHKRIRISFLPTQDIEHTLRR